MGDPPTKKFYCNNKEEPPVSNEDHLGKFSHASCQALTESVQKRDSGKSASIIIIEP